MKKGILIIGILLFAFNAQSQSLSLNVQKYPTNDSVDEVFIRLVGADEDSAIFYVEERFDGKPVRQPKNVKAPIQAIPIMIQRPIDIDSVNIILGAWNIVATGRKED